MWLRHCEVLYWIAYGLSLPTPQPGHMRAGVGGGSCRSTIYTGWWECVRMCVCVGTAAEPVGTTACCSVGRASCCCAKLLLLLLLLLLAACGARCIVSQGTTRQLPTSPFLRFRGRALPIGNTGGGCDEQARARAAVLLLRAVLLLCCCAVDSEADFQAAGLLWAFFCR